MSYLFFIFLETKNKNVIQIRSIGTPPMASSGNPFKPPAMEFSKDPINTLQALKKKVTLQKLFGIHS